MPWSVTKILCSCWFCWYEIVTGVFGRVYAGYGYLDDSRYSAGANINEAIFSQ